MIQGETDLRHSVIASLELVKVPEGSTFLEQRVISKAKGCIWLMCLDGVDWLLPKSTPDHVLEEALYRVAGTTTDDPRLLKALYDLWLTTKHEKLSEDMKEDTIRAYQRKLNLYPPHLALVAIGECQANHFFPSWSELEEKLRGYGGWRSAMIFALNRARPILTALRSQEPT